ncbi:MAG TPA: hypothetical protein VGB66_12305, partial [Longimicrobium sp.]
MAREILLHTVGWTLVHSLWQCTVVAFGLWAGLRLSHRASAVQRYALACLALLVMAASAGSTAAVAFSSFGGPGHVSTDHPARLAAVAAPRRGDD